MAEPLGKDGDLASLFWFQTAGNIAASVSNLRGPVARLTRYQRSRPSTDKSVDLQTHCQAANVYVRLNEKNNCLSTHVIAFEKLCVHL